MAETIAPLPRQLYESEAVRQLDRLAINHFDTTGFELMRRAGKACLHAIRKRWPLTAHLVVFAGAGNNGGDGYVLAALSRELGITSEVLYLSPPEQLAGDASKAYKMAVGAGAEIHPFVEAAFALRGHQPNTLLVDAMLGTGLSRLVSGDYVNAIRAMNACQAPVLAVDVPSGLNADTGEAFNEAVSASQTITFVAIKQGLLTGSALNYTGDLCFDDLGLPEALYSHAQAPVAGVKRIDINSVLGRLSPRLPASHKGNCGHVMVIGGDEGYGGAPLMAAEASLRSGAGLVSVVSRSEHRAAFLARRPELMMHGTEDNDFDFDRLLQRASVLVIGPGMGLGPWGEELLRISLQTASKKSIPVIIDADALTLLARNSANYTSIKKDTWILTPHPGEAARLLDVTASDIQLNRFAAIRTLQDDWGGSCLLKGSGSLISNAVEPDLIELCSEGNAGMATAGMGDILTGVIAALLAQGLPPAQALSYAVCIHGEAADLCAGVSGQKGLLATDLLPQIRHLLNIDRVGGLEFESGYV
ncbi:MAG: NAD(P)H-hydrate dehydratase [Pseudomonadota bacterium]|nr:NAD(P)H-hydrate dehydratase [Pseudomonadota bacterium]